MDLTPHLEAIRGDLESSLGSDDENSLGNAFWYARMMGSSWSTM